MITSTQAQEYLKQMLGVGVPAFILDAAIDTIAPAEQAMIDAGYSLAQRTMVQTYAVVIIAAAGDPRRVTSQTAPSGASQSFKYAESSLTWLRRALAALDPAGTVTALIGPDPASNTMFMVVC